MKVEQTECSETSAYKIQTPENYPEENMQHTEHGESLKSRNEFNFHLPYRIFPLNEDGKNIDTAVCRPWKVKYCLEL
jgi:hypothetical protein